MVNPLKISCARKVKYFITEATLSEQKDTFEKCINGYYEKNNMSNASPIDVEEEQKKQKEQTFQGKYISVAGSCHRIGTTTQALQIVKYGVRLQMEMLSMQTRHP